jgi:DNA-binding FadR family transcriptional regulator
MTRTAKIASFEDAGTDSRISVPEIWDVRRTIELRTAELAATSRTEEEAVEIAALAGALAGDSHDLEARTALDMAFHAAVARAGHNALFIQIMASFEPLLTVAVPAAWRTRTTDGQRRIMVERHLAIANAIVRQDPVAATMAMSAHFDAAIGDMLRATRRRTPVAVS